MDWLLACEDALVAIDELFWTLNGVAHASSNFYRQILRAIIIVFVLACGVILLWLSRRVTKEVQHIMRLTTTMLLLLPEDVFRSTPDLMAHVQSLASSVMSR